MEAPKQKVPTLQHIAEFEKVLKDYTPSQSSLEKLRATPLVLLVGPTAAGKNTLIGLLTQTGRYKMIVSDTTRPPRIANGSLEKNGEVYWFKTEEEILEGLKKGEYIEAAIIHKQQVTGANVSEVFRAQKSGLTALNEIEIVGESTYRKLHPEALSVFLLPPSFETWMQRIKSRGGVTDQELRRRLQSAGNEIVTALGKDYFIFVINHEIHEAAALVDSIVRGEDPDTMEEQKARDFAKQLIIDIQLYLDTK